VKQKINFQNCLLLLSACIVGCFFLHPTTLHAQDTAQDSTSAANQKPAHVKAKPVKNTFQSIWLIDDQSVYVPIKGTFEFDIQHRFGVVSNGYQDFYGMFASANIRLGMGYAPINNLYLGVGLEKLDETLDGSLKYAIIKQTNTGSIPVSVTYYGDMNYETRPDPTNGLYKYQSDRFSFYNSIIIARKFSDKFSLQITPSIAHQNNVTGFYTKNDSTGTSIFQNMKHDQFTLGLAGRYKLGESTAFIFDYDQPITQQPTNNPHPNVAAGFEFSTSGHTFQIFMGNYSNLNPAKNSLFNANNPFPYTDYDGTKVKGGMFVIGFTINRLWNF
jgi:hypothetical protein